MLDHDFSFYLMGHVQAYRKGDELCLGSARQRALFATLALQANKVVSRERLVRSVWGETPPATVNSSVHTYIYRLRRALSQDSASPVTSVKHSGYQLTIDPSQIDTRRFERHVEQGHRMRSAGRLCDSNQEFDTALSLWRGEVLEGVCTPLVDMERYRFEELRFSAVETQVNNLLDMGWYHEAINKLCWLIHHYPLREGLSKLLITAYEQAGRRAEALTEFQRIRWYLVEELGVEPSEELQQQHMRLLMGTSDPDTTALRPPDKVLPPPSPQPTPSSDGQRDAPAQLPRDIPVFVGRKQEFEMIRALADTASTHSEPSPLLLTGGPGVGKSTLAVHAAHALADRFPDGQLYVDLEGFSSSNDPMRSLHALQSLLTGLGENTALPLGGLKEHAGRYRSLTVNKRMIIVLDNAFSSEQVRSLIPGSSSCLVIVTSRHNLGGLVALDGARRINVDIMHDSDSSNLLHELMARQGISASKEIIERIASACGHLPIALRIAATLYGSSRAAVRLLAKNPTSTDVFLLLSRNRDKRSNIGSIVTGSIDHLSNDVTTSFLAMGDLAPHELTLDNMARAIAADPCQIREWFDELVDANLARWVQDDRVELHRLVHAYARTSGGAQAQMTVS